MYALDSVARKRARSLLVSVSTAMTLLHLAVMPFGCRAICETFCNHVLAKCCNAVVYHSSLMPPRPELLWSFDALLCTKALLESDCLVLLLWCRTAILLPVSH